MALAPEIQHQKIISFFQGRGADPKVYGLLRAAYNDETKKAITIVQTDPQQLNMRDPYAGLTPLHIAIFRSNFEIVGAIVQHPNTDLSVKDNFGRVSTDMLDYVTDQRLFELIMDVCFPDEMRALTDENFEQGMADGSIVPFRPRDRDP